MAQSRENIAFCGLDCEECPAYIATQKNDREGLKRTAETWSRENHLDITPDDCICDGCHPYDGSKTGTFCGECPMRACGLKKSYPNCAYCPDYPCTDLAKFQAGVGGIKQRLDAIRQQIGRD